MTTSKAALPCPHCKGPMHTRSSRSLTAYYRQSYMACLDPECGATYGAAHEITHQISASAKPDPLVLIRRSAPRKPIADPAVPIVASAIGDAPILSGIVGAGGPEVPPAAANDDGIVTTRLAGGPVWVGYDPGIGANDDGTIDAAANN